MPPEFRKEDFHMDVTGTYDNHQQYFGFALFLNNGQNHPVSVLNLLDRDGNHIESSIWKTNEMDEAEKSLNEAVSDLENSKSGDIILKPFKFDKSGLNMEFIPIGDGGHYSSVSHTLTSYISWTASEV